MSSDDTKVCQAEVILSAAYNCIADKVMQTHPCGISQKALAWCSVRLTIITRTRRGCLSRSSK